MIRLAIPSLLLLITWATGCASGAPAAEPVERGPTYPYSLRVAQPEILYEPTAPGGDSIHSYAVQADPSILQEALRDQDKCPRRDTHFP